MAKTRNLRHGYCRDTVGRAQEWLAWRNLKDRCYNPRNKLFARYGGRGIKVCDAWRQSFEAFLADVGHAPSPKHMIGRVNNDGHYEPGNVRWETRMEQMRNKSDNHIIEFNGRREHLSEWSRITGIEHSTILYRLRAGWAVEKTLTTPVGIERSRYLEFRGRRMRLSEWSKETGIPRLTIKRRIDDFGWPIARALSEPIWGTHGHYLEHDGKRLMISEWAKITGIPAKTIQMRIARSRWPAERALTTPVK